MVVMCLGARAIFYSMHTAEWCGYGVVKTGIVKCNGTPCNNNSGIYLYLIMPLFEKNKTDNTTTSRLYLLVYHDPSKYSEP